MANWYVSVTTGNDSNDGTSIANACATLSKAAELVAAGGSAGDSIFIAPGTYRGQFDNNGAGDGLDGTLAAPIKWIGDVNSEVFTAIEPGIVRLTYSDENDIPKGVTGTDMVVDIRNREHNHFYNLSIDGTTYGSAQAGYCVYGNVIADDNRLYNCTMQASNLGCRYVRIVEGCAISNCAYGVYQSETVNNCVFFGLALYGIFATQKAHNNLLIGVSSVPIWGASSQGHFVNNTIIGGNISSNVQNSSGKSTFWNTAIFGSNIGHKGNANNYSYVTASYMQGVTKLGQRSHVDIIHYGGGMYNGDSWNSTDHENADFIFRTAPVTLWSHNQLMDLARVAKPSVLTTGLRGRGTQAYYTGDDAGTHNPTLGDSTGQVQFDILGHPRDMGEASASHDKAYASTRDIGCWEYSDVFISSSAAGQVTMSIEGEGQFTIPIAVASGSSVTASADIKLRSSAVAAGKLQPQFILRQRSTEPSSSFSAVGQSYSYASGTLLHLSTSTSAAADNVWGTLTVQAGPMKRDTILEAVLYSRTTGSASTSSISNIVIQ